LEDRGQEAGWCATAAGARTTGVCASPRRAAKQRTRTKRARKAQMRGRTRRREGILKTILQKAD
jgi:hypothetical protein